MKNFRFSLPIFLLLFIFNSFQAKAQWQQTSGLYGGVINCLTVLDSNLFVGIGNCVYISTDNGISWNKCLNNGVWALEAIGSNLFAGGNYGSVYLSTNNGVSWKAINIGTAASVRAFAFYCNGIADTNLFAATQAGVFLTTNSGSNWTAMNDGLEWRDVWSIAVSKSNILAGTQRGFFISTNNGTNWTRVNNDLAYQSIYSLAVSGNYLYAADGHLYFSTDDGINRSAINHDSINGSIHTIAASGTNLFASAEYGRIYLSVDNGIHWVAQERLPNYFVSSFAFNGPYIFAGTDNGIFRSTNSGINWTEVNARISWNNCTNTCLFRR